MANTSYLILVAVGILAGVFALLTQYAIIGWQKEIQAFSVRVDAKNRQDADSRIAASSAMAALANESAAKANERAAKATNEAARLGLKVDALPAFVAEKETALNALAERMKKSGVELDQARKYAQTSQASAEAALEKFRKEAGPRNLTAAQSQKITAMLRGKISIKVDVQSNPGDVEAYPFAQQILASMKSAEIAGEWQPWSIISWFNEPGVFVVTAGEVDKRQADLVLSALNAAGLGARPAQMAEDMAPKPPAPGKLSIVVWKQPPPSLPN